MGKTTADNYIKSYIDHDKNTKYALSNYYSLKTYEDLYNFFKENKADVIADYYDDILSAFGNLARECDDRLEIEMKARFAKMLNECKQADK